MAFHLMKAPRYFLTNLPCRVLIPTTLLESPGILPSDYLALAVCSWCLTHIVRVAFASSVQGALHARKGSFMKKTKDEMRPEYKRSDFKRLERGKFYVEAVKGTSVALLKPAIAKAFPTSEAVNEALSGLLALTEQTARITGRSKRVPRKRVAV